VPELLTFWLDPTGPAPDPEAIPGWVRSCAVAQNVRRELVGAYLQEALEFHAGGWGLLGLVPASLRPLHAKLYLELRSAGLALGRVCWLLHRRFEAARQRAMPASTCPRSLRKLARAARHADAVRTVQRAPARPLGDGWLFFAAVPLPVPRHAQHGDEVDESGLDMAIDTGGARDRQRGE
jgi:hypothetical protein